MHSFSSIGSVWRSALVFFANLLLLSAASAQQDTVVVRLNNPERHPLANVTVALLRSDSSVQKIFVTDNAGMATVVYKPGPGYLLRASAIGYQPVIWALPPGASTQLLTLQYLDRTLAGVTVVSRKPFIELRPDKTVVNMEASVANVGSTLLEALEKLPGITIDKDGNISLKGRRGVMVMVDGKPTYLDGPSLSALLSGMSADQVAQIELIDNPPARYDAMGNGGLINIKTKKSNQNGFNLALTSSGSQGYYPRNNNNLQLNYRTGRWNLFGNYTHNDNVNFSRIEAFRTYKSGNNGVPSLLLDQPSFVKWDVETNAVRGGADYSASANTTVGLTFSATRIDRTARGKSDARWLRPNGVLDSLIFTRNNTDYRWDNLTAGLRVRHVFAPDQELTADIDYLGYDISNRQLFENISLIPGNYSEASDANIPNNLRILSAKADYSHQWKGLRTEAGWKSVYTTTDNLADYKFLDGNIWRNDFGRSNHFLYDETIHAFYTSLQGTAGKWDLQGGLRYEQTDYKTHQLGNPVVPGQKFSRRYNSLFPTLNVSFNADSNHTFTVRGGRRIERPQFQKLNPFLFIINKYTFQRGNPFFQPQFTWNGEISHLYKQFLLTGISYSLTTDYFSQLFLIDSNGIVLYTEGNLGQLRNLGLSVGIQKAPAKWWSFSLQGILNRKRMEGVVVRPIVATITQYSVNLNNQFRFNKGWTAELTGFYNSRSQHDIQEVLDPAGQLSLGVGKSILQNKGTIRFALRDVFYTNWNKGVTQFVNAVETFKVTRDTRMATLSLTLRLGKNFKNTRRPDNGTADEIQRVGTGN